MEMDLKSNQLPFIIEKKKSLHCLSMLKETKCDLRGQNVQWTAHIITSDGVWGRFTIPTTLSFVKDI